MSVSVKVKKNQSRNYGHAGQLERFGIGHADTEMLACSLCGDPHHLDVMVYGVQAYSPDTDDVIYFCPDCVQQERFTL